MRPFAARVAILAAAVVAAAATAAPAAEAQSESCADMFRLASTSPMRLSGARSLGQPVPGDFDRDGDQDLVLPANSGGVIVLLSAGDGGFMNPRRSAAGAGPIGNLGAGDLDGDGRLDLVATGGFEGDRVSMLIGNDGGSFSTRATQTYGPTPELLAMGDLNGDGRADVVLSTRESVVENGYMYSDQVLHVLLAGAGGALVEAPGGVTRFDYWAPPVPNPSPDVPFTNPRDVHRAQIGDVNDDGRADIVVSVDLEGGIQTFLGDGTGRLQPVDGSVSWGGVAVDQGVGGVGPIALADFDRDGRVDLAAVTSFAGLTVARGDGSGRFVEIVGSRRGVASSGQLVAADFDGDGNLDLAISRYGDPSLITILLGDGSGRFRPAPGSPERPIRNPRISASFPLSAADFDADGLADLAVMGPALAILLNETERRGQNRARGHRTAISVSSRRITYGDAVTVTAQLGCGVHELGGHNVTLYRRLVRPMRPGPWTRIATQTSDRTGRVSAQDRPPVNVQYRWRVDDAHGRAPMSRSVQLRVAARITVADERLNARVGATVALSGSVAPAHPGYTVALQRHDGRWHTIAHTALTRDNAFRFSVRSRHRGDRQYRVLLAADPYHTSGYSAPVRVRFR